MEAAPPLLSAIVAALACKKSTMVGKDRTPTFTVAEPNVLAASAETAVRHSCKEPSSHLSAICAKPCRRPSIIAFVFTCTPQLNRTASCTRAKPADIDHSREGAALVASHVQESENTACTIALTRSRYLARPGPWPTISVTAWSIPITDTLWQLSPSSRSIRFAVLPSLSQRSGTLSTLLIKTSNASKRPTLHQKSWSASGPMPCKILCTSIP
mmetsp:Transcript_106279/g.195121  ORF Transcript_106279/g.195121 Transcript_106279/m.195121 type:complete len:213 (+) Transcript_106279:42-680(+)